MRYRPSYHFVTKAFVPCPICAEFKEEKELVKRSRYIYGAGWLDIPSCCNACWDKAQADHQAKADSAKSVYSDLYGG